MVRFCGFQKLTQKWKFLTFSAIFTHYKAFNGIIFIFLIYSHFSKISESKFLIKIVVSPLSMSRAVCEWYRYQWNAIGCFGCKNNFCNRFIFSVVRVFQYIADGLQANKQQITSISVLTYRWSASNFVYLLNDTCSRER